MITLENLVDLQSTLAQDEAVLVLSEANRFYLTGFPSSSGFCLITAEARLFYTDSRYIEAAGAAIAVFTVKQESGRRSNIYREVLAEYKITRLHVEATQMDVAAFRALECALEGVTLIADGELDKKLLKYREIKTAEEVACIEKAAAISDQAFLQLLDLIRPGVSERDLAAELEYRLKKNGGDGLAFETIAVTGANSSKPHGVPGNALVADGDFITFDFGASYRGYLSDMTRTVAVGHVTDERKKVYNTVLKAQLAGLEAIRPGVICSDVDKISRDIIGEAGYGEYFGHGLGHCVGIEIHEMPSLSPSCKDVLKENMIITCEPGIYLPGKFGVRIEDSVMVTAEGCKPLNKVSKELIIL